MTGPWYRPPAPPVRRTSKPHRHLNLDVHSSPLPQPARRPDPDDLDDVLALLKVVAAAALVIGALRVILG